MLDYLVVGCFEVQGFDHMSFLKMLTICLICVSSSHVLVVFIVSAITMDGIVKSLKITQVLVHCIYRIIFQTWKKYFDELLEWSVFGLIWLGFFNVEGLLRRMYAFFSNQTNHKWLVWQLVIGIVFCSSEPKKKNLFGNVFSKSILENKKTKHCFGE